MAAGLSIYRKHLEEFQFLFDKYVKEHMTDEILAGKIEVDVADLSPEYITLDNAVLFKNATPWGQKFEEPVFSGTFDVLEKKIVGAKHLKLKLVKDAAVFDGIAFNVVKDGIDPFNDVVDVVYKLSINEFRGRVSLQLMVDYMQNTQELNEESEDEFWSGNAV